MSSILTYLFCGMFVVNFCAAIEPISSTVGVVGGIVISAAYAGWEYTKCHREECCSDKYVKLNFSGLQSSLKRSLHGQHLVEHTVARSVRGHIQNRNPKKALVMAFHGWTGSGKNFVSNLIAENLYSNGMKSKYVHLYIATQHFPHSSDVKEYKEKLQKDVKKYTQLCGRSLFIFDELDKMPEGVLDILKPYIDFHEDVDGIDYRKNIFIFLSNAGGDEITRLSFNFWLNGKDREEIKMKDIEPLISKGAFNEKGGLRHSEIVKSNLIDVYVPFFPLEKKHVKQCIEDELRSRFQPVNSDKVDLIADQLEYYPSEFELYSQSGCKKVSQKVDVYGDED